MHRSRRSAGLGSSVFLYGSNLAGLWLGDLIQWLGWTTLRSSDRVNTNACVPSWSWAKLDGASVRTSKLDHDTADAVVLHAETVLAGQVNFGDVASGKIMPLGRVRTFTGEVGIIYGYQQRMLVPENETSSKSLPLPESMDWTLDRSPPPELEDAGQTSPIPCLLLKWHISKHLAYIKVLTLEAVEGMPGSFRRTGVACGFGSRSQDKQRLKPFNAVFSRWAAIEKQQLTLI